MTRIVLARNERDPSCASLLREAGYRVEECAVRPSAACPALAGHACPLLERADVLVYSLTLAGAQNGQRRLVDELRALYADKALVLIEPTSGHAWVDRFAEPAPDEGADDSAERVPIVELVEEALAQPF